MDGFFQVVEFHLGGSATNKATLSRFIVFVTFFSLFKINFKTYNYGHALEVYLLICVLICCNSPNNSCKTNLKRNEVVDCIGSCLVLLSPSL